MKEKSQNQSTGGVDFGEDFGNLPAPDVANLRDHYTDAHRAAFYARFFGKKSVEMRFAKQLRNAITFAVW